MTIAAFPFHSLRLQRKPLVTCLTAGLLAAASLPGSAQTNADTSWLRFRADPARRIFATLPAAHAPSQRPAAVAATWPVQNCADDGPGSLRAAITGAGDGDTIDLTQLSCATITLETGAIEIPLDNLTLSGPGRSRLAIDGNDLDRVFLHPGGGSLVLRAMTLRHGHDRATGFHVAGGGCVASAGYVILDATTVSDCYAGGEGAYGGGLYAYSLTMSDSTLSGNVANGVHKDAGTAAFGGGAFVYTMSLVDSTVSGNRTEHHIHEGRESYDIGAGIITVRGGTIDSSTVDSNYSEGRGGGIATFSDMSTSNSTFSANVAATSIGGAFFIRRPSALLVSNSTISGNHAEAGGGGVWLAAPGSQMQSSIVFGNSAGAAHFANMEAASPVAVTGSNNLIGGSDPGVALPADTLVADPLLGPLAHNGGLTRTHALPPGSPAVDVGINAAGLAFDQRGAAYPRVYGAAADIGAFEQQAPLPQRVQAPVPALSDWMLGLLTGLAGLSGLRANARIRARIRRD